MRIAGPHLHAVVIAGPATSAKLRQPVGLAFDPPGITLYIVEVQNAAVRAVSPAGTISVVAGVLGAGWCSLYGNVAIGTSTRLTQPQAVVADGAGGFVVQDLYNNVVRQLAGNTAIVTTIAGTGAAAFTGNNGPATAATLHGPASVASDGRGGFYIADSANAAIRWLRPSGTGYDISTIAGTGVTGYSCVERRAANRFPTPSDLPSACPPSSLYSGDGGPATNATLTLPSAISVDNSTGNIYFTVSLPGSELSVAR